MLIQPAIRQQTHQACMQKHKTRATERTKGFNFGCCTDPVHIDLTYLKSLLIVYENGTVFAALDLG